MRDRYGRAFTDLRVSLTQRCNLRCVFCHMEGQLVSQAELPPEQIEHVVRAAVRAGVERVKLTGGEPTLRSDIVEIVRRIAALGVEVSMTTNGLRLANLAEPLRAAGLSRVNVSLPSLNAATYRELTGVDGLDRAVAGIRAAVAAGMGPVKLNVVALAGTNADPDAFERLIGFAREVGAWIQVIEFENVRGRVDPEVYRSLHSELGRLTQDAVRSAFPTGFNPLHHRPRYSVSDGGPPVTLEVVQPVENPSFCMACERLRLTSDGHLKGCLMTNDGLVDLRPILSEPHPEKALDRAFALAVDRRRPFFVGPETPVPERSLFGEGDPLPMVGAHP
ncbi:MAG: GTP 3',8-cyclase MoaA [Thermoplasmata archaeon]|nr:GTP 3',8-cyclase MoaA [Thermoplasmata archaeon]MCI4361855.1 GTP 3',8-cyclase MoaA [Thermoplasmata archaeon]